MTIPVKGGRPKLSESEKRNHSLRFRMNEEELQLFDRKFAESKMAKQKDFFMALLQLSDHIDTIVELKSVMKDKLTKIQSDIAHSSGNINQVAKVVNYTGFANTSEQMSEQLQQVLDENKKLVSAVQKLNKLVESLNLKK